MPTPPKKKVDVNAVMNSPEMKKAMAVGQSMDKTAAAFRGKGTVSGAPPPPAPAKAKKPQSEVVKTTAQVARGMGYAFDKGKGRTKRTNDAIDAAAKS